MVVKKASSSCEFTRQKSRDRIVDSNNNNNNLNIFMQDCCFSFKKKTAINAGPVKN